MDYACDFGSSQEVYENGVVPDTLLDPTVSTMILLQSPDRFIHADAIYEGHYALHVNPASYGIGP